ncbi:hypothetical protein APF79_03505 [bacterium BRH_c32]|nr:MAG: hypothetical protein APF79_03505 [bacterium BRH_c32]
MVTEQPVLVTSIKAYVALSKNRIVCFNRAHGMTNPMGVCAADTKLGEHAPIITHGIATIESGESIFAGEKIGPDSLGRAVPFPFYNDYLGKALDGAETAGILIRVVLNIPQ